MALKSLQDAIIVPKVCVMDLERSTGRVDDMMVTGFDYFVAKVYPNIEIRVNRPQKRPIFYLK
jgi:hypothetical protein